MDVPSGFDPTLTMALNLLETFVLGLSGGLAAVRAPPPVGGFGATGPDALVET